MKTILALSIFALALPFIVGFVVGAYFGRRGKPQVVGVPYMVMQEPRIIRMIGEGVN